MIQCLASGAMEVGATWRDVSPAPMLSLPKLTNALICSLSWRGDLKGLGVTGNNFIYFSLPAFFSGQVLLDMQARDATMLIVVISRFDISSSDLGLNLPWYITLTLTPDGTVDTPGCWFGGMWWCMGKNVTTPQIYLWENGDSQFSLQLRGSPSFPKSTQLHLIEFC